ncbi:MAG: hypothetical protein ACUVQ6_04535 [Dissulfurimicrobium sp.]
MAFCSAQALCIKERGRTVLCRNLAKEGLRQDIAGYAFMAGYIGLFRPLLLEKAEFTVMKQTKNGDLEFITKKRRK